MLRLIQIGIPVSTLMSIYQYVIYYVVIYRYSVIYKQPRGVIQLFIAVYHTHTHTY